ncbi:MAG: hypothetical protein GX665_05320 [Gammaproteobacteria bacterium]|nr:hypothetical protein [Gammaproteobacteria bacterium]
MFLESPDPAREQMRADIAAATARYEKANGRVKTLPLMRRDGRCDDYRLAPSAKSRAQAAARAKGRAAAKRAPKPAPAPKQAPAKPTPAAKPRAKPAPAPSLYEQEMAEASATRRKIQELIDIVEAIRPAAEPHKEATPHD